MNSSGIDKEISVLSELLRAINSTLSKNITGNINCSSSHGTYQYLLDGKYLKKKNWDIARQICARDFYAETKPLLEERLEALLQLKELYKTDCISQTLNKLPPGRKKLLEDIIITNKQKVEKFTSIQYHGKAFNENDTTEFFTDKGERVRSKAEILIANELKRNKIPYHYEMPLELTINNKSVTFYPDFTVMKPSTCEIKYIEHMGLMDSITYVQKSLSKLDVFERNGLFIGDDIILFHETYSSPLSTKTVNSYIKKYLM